MWPPRRRPRPNRRRLAARPSALRLPRVQVAVPERERAAVHMLAPEAASVPQARRLATEFASDRMSDGQSSKLSVAITEVVANSVRHSGSADAIRVVLTLKPAYL